MAAGHLAVQRCALTNFASEHGLDVENLRALAAFARLPANQGSASLVYRSLACALVPMFGTDNPRYRSLSVKCQICNMANSGYSLTMRVKDQQTVWNLDTSEP